MYVCNTYIYILYTFIIIFLIKEAAAPFHYRRRTLSVVTPEHRLLPLTPQGHSTSQVKFL